MFYSKSTSGFYSADIHGSRKLVIADPAWTRPLIDGEPDLDAVAPTVEIGNPGCKIPADAVEITDEQHAALLEGQGQGKRIIADADGRPVLAEPEPPTSEQLRAVAVADINATRETGLVTGVVVNGKRYHSDDRFLTELLGMVLGYQAGIYSGTQDIRTMDNQIEPLDFAQITALAAAVGAHRKVVYAASWAAKDAL